jgi:hypothetical protein
MASFPFRRIAVLAAALSLGWGAWLVMRLVAPATDPVVTWFVAIMPPICGGTLAILIDDKGLSGFLPSIVCFAIVTCGAAIGTEDSKQMGLLFGLASLGLMLSVGYSLAKSTHWRSIARAWGHWAIGLALVAALGLYAVYYVSASHDLMFGDFIYRRVEAIIVASNIDDGNWIALIRAFVSSMKDEYSLLPAMTPGIVLAGTSVSSRAWYQGAVIVCYAAPAYFALGVLARDLAWPARSSRLRAARSPTVLALAIGAAFVAYPTGMAVVARGMPDIGGIVLVVAALRLSDRLARLLTMRRGHDAQVERLIRRVVLALALSLFGMFLFRRWYAFAAAGILIMLMFEVALLATLRPYEFRWRSAIGVAALGGLVLIALGAPIFIDWLPNPVSHDYVTIYAAYRKEPAVVLAEIFDWYGAALLIAALCCAIFLASRAGDRRLLRLTCGSTLVAALLFLHVQSPNVHHVYLLTPAFTALIGASMLVMFSRWKPGAAILLVGLAIVTLTPAVSSWAPKGLAPTAGQPPAPRTDLAELSRLKAWVDANAAPDHRYCVLASSYTINDSLVDELWQLVPNGTPLAADPSLKINVGMPHVDTRDGPPIPELKNCAIMMVGDPVQTHLVPSYQQNVILPASEMLSGVGIGASYRRNGEVFNLEKGVKLVVFERIRHLDDDDIAALQARWRAARGQNASILRGTSSD